MNVIAPTVAIVLVLAVGGCAGKPVFMPIKPDQFASTDEARTAFQLADVKCQAAGYNAVAQMPRHVEPTVLIPTAKSPGQRFNESYARSNAQYQRTLTAQANFKACMAAEGFIEQRQD